MAGALLPGSWYVKAQRFRRHYRAAVLKLFDEVDIILAPATPCSAPKLGQVMMKHRRCRAAGARQSRPVHPADLLHRPAGRGGAPAQPGGLPIGVQVIANHYNEAAALRVARISRSRACGAPPA